MAALAGVFVYVLSMLNAIVAQNIQRFAQRTEPPRPRLNLLGIGLQLLGAPADMLAYSFAPQALLAPLGMVGLSLNLVVAPRLHGDAIQTSDFLATALVVAGSVICLSYGPDDDFSELDGSSSLAPSRPKLASYALFVNLLCLTLGGGLVALRNSGGRADAAFHAVLAGVLGSTTVVGSKIITSALQQWDAEAPQRMLWASLHGIGAIVGAAPIQIFVQNRGLGRHSAVVMMPVTGAAGFLANVATGLLLYSEVPTSARFFGLGVGLLLCGAALLCGRELTGAPASKVRRASSVGSWGGVQKLL